LPFSIGSPFFLIRAIRGFFFEPVNGYGNVKYPVLGFVRKEWHDSGFLTKPKEPILKPCGRVPISDRRGWRPRKPGSPNGFGTC